MALSDRMYAEALFEAAKGEGRLAEVREDLGDFVAVLGEVGELRNVLRNPQLDPKTKALIGLAVVLTGNCQP